MSIVQHLYAQMKTHFDEKDTIEREKKITIAQCERVRLRRVDGKGKNVKRKRSKQFVSFNRPVSAKRTID